jgi:predicted enzyme related to lactoylglutathione lyase
MDHTIVHFELPADDPERAAAFYRDLFGWTIRKWQAAGGKTEGAREGGPMEYWMVSTVPTDEQGRPTRAGVNGGMMRRMHPGQTPVNYISVESVEEHARKAEGLGAEVVVPKTPVAGMGWFVWLKDPESNVFGIWQEDPRAG